MNIAYLSRIHAALDPTNKLVIWAYPSTNTVGGSPDKLIIYSWAFNRWVLVEGLSLDYLTQAATTGYALEGLDAISSSIDGLPVSLDSNQWTGGQLILSAFNSAHRMGRFNGSPMAAQLDTGEFQFLEGRAMLTEIRPDVVGLSASLSLTIMNRNSLTESVSAGASIGAPNATGFVPCRTSARYFRIRLATAAGSDFTHLIGVEVSGVPAGVR
jgi:hypothetical protein